MLIYVHFLFYWKRGNGSMEIHVNMDITGEQNGFVIFSNTVIKAYWLRKWIYSFRYHVFTFYTVKMNTDFENIFFLIFSKFSFLLYKMWILGTQMNRFICEVSYKHWWQLVSPVSSEKWWYVMIRLYRKFIARMSYRLQMEHRFDRFKQKL